MAIRKICASCGGYNKESATFCDKCGQSNLIEQEVADAPEDGDISILINKSDNENLKKASQNATFMKYKMKWHDVLSSWLLYVWGVFNVFYGLLCLLNGAVVPAILSMVYGVVCFIASPRLRALDKKGVYLFLGLMGMDIAVSLGVVLTGYSSFASIILSLVFDFANIIYYINRSELFD